MDKGTFLGIFFIWGNMRALTEITFAKPTMPQIVIILSNSERNAFYNCRVANKKITLIIDATLFVQLVKYPS